MLSMSLASPMRKPSREPCRTCGDALMFSWPPAMTMSASPHLIACAARCVALSPLPQTLPIVMPGTLSGRPARMSACRAGVWPTPAVSTCPKITSEICSGCSWERTSSARMIWAPKSAAGTLPIAPLNFPTADRTAAVMTISFMCLYSVVIARCQHKRERDAGRHGAPRIRPANLKSGAKSAHLLFGLGGNPAGVRGNLGGLCCDLGRRFLGHFDETALRVRCQRDEFLRSRAQLLAERSGEFHLLGDEVGGRLRSERGLGLGQTPLQVVAGHVVLVAAHSVEGLDAFLLGLQCRCKGVAIIFVDGLGIKSRVAHGRSSVMSVRRYYSAACMRCTTNERRRI